MNPEDPVIPGKPAQQTIEAALASRANDAMAKGADPQAATARLGQVVKHLQANPDVRSQAQAALDQGADPDAIGARVYQHSLSAPAPVMPTKLAIAKRNAAMPHPEDMEDAPPSYAQQALGGIAALNHDIPGAEAAQAGVRSVVRGQSYTDALSDIKGAEASAPAGVRIGNNIIGGTIAALAGPKGTYMRPFGTGGSAAIQGARYGVAQGALSADPMSNQDRILNAGKGGAVTAATAGVIGDAPSKIAQVTKILGAQTPAAAAIARRGGISVADKAYPEALAEGAGKTHPDVTAALESPYIKPYVDAVRNSPSNEGADDATILHKTYTRLGTRQRALQNQTEHAADYRAGPEQEIQDIQLAKGKLLDASDQIMPSYRGAVEQHAKLAGQLDALKDTKDATARIMNNSNVAGRNLESNSPEAFKVKILQMKQDQAEAAREAMLGQLHAKTPALLNAKPWQGFGLPAANSAINRVSPYLQMIQDQMTGAGPAPALKDLPMTQSSGVLRRALGIAAGAQASN